MQGRIQAPMVTEDVLINLSTIFKRLEKKTYWNVFGGIILNDNETIWSKHYSSKKWFLSSYVENAMRSAMNWKDINNEAVQWSNAMKQCNEKPL